MMSRTKKMERQPNAVGKAQTIRIRRGIKYEDGGGSCIRKEGEKKWLLHHAPAILHPPRVARFESKHRRFEGGKSGCQLEAGPSSPESVV